MGNTISSMGTQFPASVVNEVFSLVNGHSSLAKLAKRMPVAFSGNDIFTFNLDGAVSIVGEGSAKPAGTADIRPVNIKPVKVVYQHRVNEEFLYASEEKQLNMLKAFKEGFAIKIAEGLDIMAMHGVNPATLVASEAIGSNHLDTVQSTGYTSGKPEAALNAGVKLLGKNNVTGYIVSNEMGMELGSYKENGISQYPEYKLGGNPGSLGKAPADVNHTVTEGNEKAMAYMGDFANAFRWGYAAQMPMKVIEYGDPDGLGDLQQNNQICLRAEAWIGWGILNKAAFAKIEKSA